MCRCRTPRAGAWFCTHALNDYIGTVAADDAVALTGEPSLYELASIDRDLYTIVAVDLRVEGPVTATVYAVDGFSQGLGPHGDAAERGDG